MKTLIRTSALVLLLAGCTIFESAQPSRSGQSAVGPVVRLAATDWRATADDTIGVAVDLESAARTPIAVSIDLRFDPSRLRYIGQPEPSAPFAIVNANDKDIGHLRIAALDPAGLTGTAVRLVFTVVGDGYAGTLTVRMVEAADRALAPIHGWRVAGAGSALALPMSLEKARPLALSDWVSWAEREGTVPSGHRPQLAPGDGFAYGDVDSDGVLRIIDAFGIANAAVGNFSVSDATKDYVVAANVIPFNVPGLGEPTDAVPPGLEPDGSRVISVIDAAAVATEAANCSGFPLGGCPSGQPGNQPVVGDPIPGRPSAAVRVILTGDIAADRALTADTVYELQGLVRVPFGVTLTINAGTRIEGETVSRGSLLVARGGRLVAAGTLLQPIVFTCTSPTPVPGCWGGIAVNGFALLNTPYSGPGPVPACPERTVPGTTEVYGGCLVEHDAGVLRYLRVEYAGQPWPSLGSQPGLSLNGIGSGTVIERIQVLGSSGDGMFVSGGHARLRDVVLMQNLGDGLRWNDGWHGKVQQLVIYRTMGTGSGLRGSNSTADPNAGPRSAPVMYNVSVIEGNAANAPANPALLFEQGSAGVIGNVVVVGWTGTVLDIQGAASCARAADSLDVRVGVLWANASNFSGDADCIDEVAFGADPGRDLMLADPQLRDLLTTLSPDYRPMFGSIAGTGASPPGDGFFNPFFTFRGGAPVATSSGSTIPWFMGWTKGY